MKIIQEDITKDELKKLINKGWTVSPATINQSPLGSLYNKKEFRVVDLGPGIGVKPIIIKPPKIDVKKRVIQ